MSATYTLTYLLTYRERNCQETSWRVGLLRDVVDGVLTMLSGSMSRRITDDTSTTQTHTGSMSRHKHYTDTQTYIHTGSMSRHKHYTDIKTIKNVTFYF